MGRVELGAPLGALLGSSLGAAMLAWCGRLGWCNGRECAWQAGEALPLASEGLAEVRRQLLWLGNLALHMAARMLRELDVRSQEYSTLFYHHLAISESW